MRINRFIALATGLSRRAADKLADAGEIFVNGRPIRTGREVSDVDVVTFRGRRLRLPKKQTIMLNKPAGYVCSRTGQGSKTVYDILPVELRRLKPVGRLDKDSSGLLIMTNDGEFAHRLTHPSFRKPKRYEVILDKTLSPDDWKNITVQGVVLEDGLSKFKLHWIDKRNGSRWMVTMSEGRNRQIRRTFAALGYQVSSLHRVTFGDYHLGRIAPGKYTELKP